MKKQSNNTTPEPIYSAIQKLDAAYKLERLCAEFIKTTILKRDPIKLLEFSIGGHVCYVSPIIDDKLKEENLSVIGSHFSSFIKHSDFAKDDWTKIINGTFLSRDFHFIDFSNNIITAKCFFELIPADNKESFVPKVIFSVFPKKSSK